MKKIFILAISSITLLLQGCVMTETIDERVPEQQTVLQSRSSDNVYMSGSDNQSRFGQVDWDKADVSDVDDFLSENTVTDIYTYDGTGADFKTLYDQPVLEYAQDTAQWKTSGFNWAVGRNISSTDEMSSLQFKDAFARIDISIANSESSLYLEVNKIRLCNMRTSGIFYFPQENGSAFWAADNITHDLLLPFEEQRVLSGDTLTLSVMQNLPIIPQRRSAWNVNYIPDKNSGVYVLLHCRIYQPAGSDSESGTDKGTPIYTDNGGYAWAAIPVSLDLKAEQYYNLLIELNVQKPWYTIKGDTPRKILQPITFDVVVDDWQVGGGIYIGL